MNSEPVEGAGAEHQPSGAPHPPKEVISAESKNEEMDRPLCPRSRGDKAIL